MASSRSVNFSGSQGLGRVDLAALGVDLLAHIARPADQADEHHGQLEVGGRARGIAGQHAQPAGIGVHFRAQRDFHGEIGDAGTLQERFDRIHLD